jgi:DNA polymerase
MASGMSIYEAYNRTAFGYTGPKMDKGSPEYGLVKIQVLQLGYQAGWEKFITTAMNEAGLDLTKDDPEFVTVVDPFTDEESQVSGYGAFAKKLVADFRAKNPKITGLWQRLDEQFKSSIGSDFVMTLPSGRKLTYEHVRGEVRIVKGKDGKPQRKSEFTAGTGDKRRAFYGGKLTENLIQATARDVFGTHLCAMDKAGLDVLFTSHDEAILEVDQSVTTKDVEQFMSVTPEWLPGCPIAAEAKEAPHYLK